VFVFLSGDRRTAPCAGARRKAGSTTARRLWASNGNRTRTCSVDTAARDSAKCQSSGAALGSQAYKECRALLEDKMSIENDVPLDRSYARTRGRNLAGTTGIRFNSVYSTEREFRRVFERLANVRMDQNQT
jgi:hypothetical protein